MIKLTDYENVILGQESRYHNFTKEQNLLRNFGIVLFEMACGFEPTKKDIKIPPSTLDQQIADIINSIYFVDPPATIDDLIAHPFFNVTPKGLKETDGDDVNNIFFIFYFLFIKFLLD